MAINTTTRTFVAGTVSTTLATAITNGNTAQATFQANANGALWNPSIQPTWLNGGVFSDATSGDYVAWCLYYSLSAS